MVHFQVFQNVFVMVFTVMVFVVLVEFDLYFILWEKEETKCLLVTYHLVLLCIGG